MGNLISPPCNALFQLHLKWLTPELSVFGGPPLVFPVLNKKTKVVLRWQKMKYDTFRSFFLSSLRLHLQKWRSWTSVSNLFNGDPWPRGFAMCSSGFRLLSCRVEPPEPYLIPPSWRPQSCHHLLTQEWLPSRTSSQSHRHQIRWGPFKWPTSSSREVKSTNLQVFLAYMRLQLALAPCWDNSFLLLP